MGWCFGELDFVMYLEEDPDRNDSAWGWFYCAGLFGFNCLAFLFANQIWNLSINSLQVALRIQLNTILFAKTLAKKDIASLAPSRSHRDGGNDDNVKKDEDEKDEKTTYGGVSTTGPGPQPCVSMTE